MNVIECFSGTLQPSIEKFLFKRWQSVAPKSSIRNSDLPWNLCTTKEQTNGVPRTTELRSQTIMKKKLLSLAFNVRRNPPEKENEDWDVTQHFLKSYQMTYENYKKKLLSCRKKFNAVIVKFFIEKHVPSSFRSVHVYSCLTPGVGVEKIIKRWEKSTLRTFFKQSWNLIRAQRRRKLNQRKMSIKHNLFARLLNK